MIAAPPRAMGFDPAQVSATDRRREATAFDETEKSRMGDG